MDSVAIEIAQTLLPPLLLAMAVAWAAGFLLSAEVAARWRAAAGAAAGMFLGYALLPDWAPLAPERHWHWLAYLPVAAAILGAAIAGKGTAAWERLLAFAVVAAVAALALVPDWDSLHPPRRVWIPLLTGYLTLIYALLAALPARVRGGAGFAYLLAVSAFGVAALVGYEVSVKYGQLGAAFASALVGVALWAILARRRGAPGDEVDAHTAPASDNGLALAAVYAVAIGSLAFVGTVEPTEPATPLLFAPLAPMALWLFAAGSLSRIKPILAAALQTLLIVAILAAIAIWLYSRAADETDEWSQRPPADAHSGLSLARAAS